MRTTCCSTPLCFQLYYESTMEALLMHCRCRRACTRNNPASALPWLVLHCDWRFRTARGGARHRRSAPTNLTTMYEGSFGPVAMPCSDASGYMYTRCWGPGAYDSMHVLRFYKVSKHADCNFTADRSTYLCGAGGPKTDNCFPLV